jgi:2-hydroxychromene-2-carboxylate isomerase
MIQTIEIFYSFQCPYSYLALDKLAQLENKFDIKCLWQPFSAKAAGQNYQSPNFSPERSSYIKDDATRVAQKMNMPFVMRADWPEKEYDPERSVRGAIVAGDLEIILEYNVKMFQRWWGDNEDPNEQSFFIELCDNLDIDPNEFAGRMSTADTRERVKGLYKRGRKLQVFDTPTVVIASDKGDERFYGIDRLNFVEARLEELGLKRPSWV